MYRTGSNEEIEQALESWLLNIIHQLEEPLERFEESSDEAMSPRSRLGA